jgi:predicted nucleic acid-binding protein
MNVLVDTSVWIDYLRSGTLSQTLDILIDDNLIVTNELVLSELIPTLTVQKQSKFIALLHLLQIQHLSIDWNEIRSIQTICLKNRFNGVGIPDLIIAQNAIQNNTPLYTLDKHFHSLIEITSLKLL